MWGKYRVFVATFIFAILFSFGFCGWSFLKLRQVHELRQEYFIPQHQALVEMERALSLNESVSFMEARSRFLDLMEPTASASFVEVIAHMQGDPQFLKDQIHPQLERRMEQSERSERVYLSSLQGGLLLVMVFVFIGVILLLGSAWNQRREIFALEERSLRQIKLASQKVELAIQKSQDVNSAVEEVRVPLGQIKGSLGLANDQVGVATDSAEAIARQLKQDQEKLTSLLSMVRSMVSETQRMRVLAEALSDLADQANLFLVNASIGVARQGEAGRGFSSVAQEVSSLAEGSGKASTELNQLIHQIDEQATQSLQTLEKEISGFSERHQLVARTHQSFEDLSKIMTHLANQTLLTEKKFQELLLRVHSMGALTK